MISYNLLTEKWIPCVDLNNNKEYHSLYSFFENTHEIKELALDNPLEEISILRFLQVFVYRAYGIEHGKENWNGI
ncbi:MAG: type I-E CRISPR-associated protein Cse1/CasA, partial [Candidatus Kapaibacterium sp.]